MCQNSVIYFNKYTFNGNYIFQYIINRKIINEMFYTLFKSKSLRCPVYLLPAIHLNPYISSAQQPYVLSGSLVSSAELAPMF